MQEASAIKAALSLLHLPSSLKRVRAEPLPRDVDILLRIAAGDSQAVADAAAAVNRPSRMVHEAAVFYIEQVLLSPQSDCYRMLGGTHETSSQDLRRNMALLLTWLHPDKNPAGDKAAVAARVTAAWSILRIPEKRATYDAGMEAAHAAASPSAEIMRRRHKGLAATGVKPPSGRSRIAHANGSGSDGLFGRSLRFLRRVLIPTSGP